MLIQLNGDFISHIYYVTCSDMSLSQKWLLRSYVQQLQKNMLHDTSTTVVCIKIKCCNFANHTPNKLRRNLPFYWHPWITRIQNVCHFIWIMCWVCWSDYNSVTLKWNTPEHFIEKVQHQNCIKTPLKHCHIISRVQYNYKKTDRHQ